MSKICLYIKKYLKYLPTFMCFSKDSKPLESSIKMSPRRFKWLWNFVMNIQKFLANSWLSAIRNLSLCVYIDGETVETVSDFIFLGSKITTDGDYSHEIKRRLFLGRKVMTNLDSIFKTEALLCQQRFV